MERLFILEYRYVDDMLRRREPHRDRHLELLRACHARGELRLAGAVGEPPSGGRLVFTTAAAAEAFLAVDPYVAEGLVIGHELLPLTVAVP